VGVDTVNGVGRCSGMKVNAVDDVHSDHVVVHLEGEGLVADPGEWNGKDRGSMGASSFGSFVRWEQHWPLAAWGDFAAAARSEVRKHTVRSASVRSRGDASPAALGERHGPDCNLAAREGEHAATPSRTSGRPNCPRIRGQAHGADVMAASQRPAVFPDQLGGEG
jgi:hypothetical protein